MIESATWAVQLSAESPRGTDARSEGPSQFALVKTVLQNELAPNAKQWVYTGHSVTRQNSASFSIAADYSTVYEAGRRVKVTGSQTGTIYGTVASVTYSASTSVNIRWDSGYLRNEAITPYVSFVTHTAFPRGKAVTSSGTTGGTGSGGSGNTYVGISINGITYKVLYDGRSDPDPLLGLVWAEGFAPTVALVGGSAGVYLENHDLDSFAFNADTFVGVKAKSDGRLSLASAIYLAPTYQDEGNEWAVSPATGIGSGYEIRLIKTSGTNPTTGTLSTWVSLATDVKWEWTQPLPGSRAFIGTLQIRPVGEAVAASCIIDVYANSELLGP